MTLYLNEGSIKPNKTIAKLVRLLITQLYIVPDINLTTSGTKKLTEKVKWVHELCNGLQHLDPFPQGDYCPYQPFGKVCLFPTPAGQFYNGTCPTYFKKDEVASDFIPQILCDNDGNWPIYDSIDDPHMLCLLTDEEFANHKHRVFIARLVAQSYKYALIGYGISAISCAVALLIFIFFRRLHCSRNFIHCHLLAALLLYSLFYIIKAILFDNGDHKSGFAHYGKVNRFNAGPEKSVSDKFEFGYPWWECKLLVLLSNFTLEATHFWLLIEGIYLHNCIFHSVFRQMKIWPYVVAGWGFPAAVTLVLIIIRVTIDDYLCWNTFANENLIWILQGPIELTLLINCVLFIRLIRELFIKMRNASMPGLEKHKKLAKIMFILILAFGLYDLMWIIPSFLFNIRKPDYTMVICMIVEYFLGSLQGLFVAFVYCAYNSEVRSEIRNSWDRFCIQHLNRSSLRRSNSPTQHSNFSSSFEPFSMSETGKISASDIPMNLLHSREEMLGSVSGSIEITENHRGVLSNSERSGLDSKTGTLLPGTR